MAGGVISYSSRIVVIVHKFLVGRDELRNEIIHGAERFIQAVKLGVNIACDGLVGQAGVVWFGVEQVVGGNRGLQQSQLRGGYVKIGGFVIFGFGSVDIDGQGNGQGRIAHGETRLFLFAAMPLTFGS